MRHKLKNRFYLFTISLLLAFVPMSFLAASPVLAAGSNCTWTGLGDGVSWSQASNWTSCGGVAPQNGDNLIFSTTSLSGPDNLTNDISSLQVGQITFNGSNAFGYLITGNAISLGGGITNNSSGSGNTLGINITLTADQSFSNSGLLTINGTTLTMGTHNLIISGSSTTHLSTAVSGSGMLTFNTTGTDFLDRNDPSLSGPIVISSGKLIFNASTPTALGTGTVSIASGTILQESINSTGTYSVTNPITMVGTGTGGSGVVDVHVFSGGLSTVNFTGAITLTGNTQISLEGANANINGTVSGCGFTISLVGGSSGTLGGTLTGSCVSNSGGAGTSSSAVDPAAPSTGFGQPANRANLLTLAFASTITLGLGAGLLKIYKRKLS